MAFHQLQFRSDGLDPRPDPGSRTLFQTNIGDGQVKRNLSPTLLFLSSLALYSLEIWAGDSKTWTTSSFLDLVDGSFADGGVNTYVAADGRVRLINVWDLNDDGNLDVVFPSDHARSDKVDLFIYWGADSGFDPSRRSSLPTQGGEAVAAADLNRDGHPELVFANSGLSFHMGVDRFQKSYIYWGAADG